MLICLVLMLSVVRMVRPACFLVPQCECPQNVNGLAVLDCSKRDLTSLPQVRVSGNAIYSIDLSSNLITVLPSRWFSRAFSSIKVVSLQDNPLTTIANDAFANTSISELYLSVTSGGSSLPPVFNWTAVAPLLGSLTNLTISGFSARTLPQNSIQDAPLLQYLSLSNNQIASIASGTFAGLSNLTWLDLSGNALSLVPTSAISQMPGLATLVLSNNQIWNLAPNCLPVNNLTYLDLSWNVVRQIDPAAFQLNLATLKYLDLSKNYLTDALVPSLSGFTALQTLKVSMNQLVVIDNLLTQCCQQAPLLYLDVSQNQIAKIAAGSFSSVASSLSTLVLDGNSQLVAVDNDTFVEMRNLTVLQANNIHWAQLLQQTPTVFSAASRLSETLRSLFLEDSSFTSSLFPTLSTLTQLRTLSLQSNMIDSIPPLFFTNFSRLLSFSLNTNPRLATIDVMSIYGLRSLQTLDLAYTSVTSVPFCATWWLPAVQVIELAGAPLNCDCNLLWLKDWAQSKSTSSVAVSSAEYTCVTPSSLAGLPVMSLSASQFVCNASQSKSADLSVSTCIDLDALLLQNATIPFSVQLVTGFSTNMTLYLSPVIEQYAPLMQSFSVSATNMAGGSKITSDQLSPDADTSLVMALNQGGTYYVCIEMLTTHGTVVTSANNCAEFKVAVLQPVASASVVVIVVPIVCGVAVIVVTIIVVLCCVKRRKAAQRARGDPFKVQPKSEDLNRLGETGTRYTKRTPGTNGTSAANVDEASVVTALIGESRGPAIYENAMSPHRPQNNSLNDGYAVSMGSRLDDSQSTLMRGHDASFSQSTTTIDTHESVPLPRRPRMGPPVRISQDRPDTTYEELPDDIRNSARVSRRESSNARMRNNPMYQALPMQRYSPSPYSQTVPNEPSDSAVLHTIAEDHRMTQTWDNPVDGEAATQNAASDLTEKARNTLT